MNRLAIYVVAAVMLILWDHIPAQAISAPHNSPCLQCHVSHNKLGDQSNELICLQCHNASSGASAQGIPFSPDDAANPFGTPNALQFSHNWNGSDLNPKAGAQPPLTPSLALPQHQGRMMCAKCHNLHGPRSSETNSAPFLRALNDQDQMCLDCHRSRDQRSHATGTHPVQVSYADAAAAAPAKFNAAPVSANPANPTAAMKLIGGKVSCSTCHGIHYADSNSKTFDNHSAALLGNLTPSAGYLLRTDYKGETADALNICTNCHAGKVAHNGKGQNIQCTDCHGGHVDEGDGSTPNVFLVRRYMSFSTAAGKLDNRAKGVPTYFQSATTKNYRDANGTGVCQGCHALPNTVPDHLRADTDCNTCHVHGNIKGAFTAACDGCHGQAPRQNVEGGPAGYAKGYVGVNEAFSPHQSHAGVDSPVGYECRQCHQGNKHASGDYQQLYLDSTGLIAAKGGVTPAYDKIARTCSVYCHSNGAPRGQQVAFAQPAWENGKGAIIGTPGECGSCHGNADTLTTNAHARHVSGAATGKQFGCATCHAATAASNTSIKDKTFHVNGDKDLLFSGDATGTQIDAAATCSTSYCHSNGKGVYATPNWTVKASGACGSCHATASGLGSTLISSGAHFTHFSTSANAYGPMFSQQNTTGCQTCHNFTNDLGVNHVNKSVDLNASLGYSGTGTGTCTPCHTRQVNWSGGQVTCESCHTGSLSVIGGVTAPDKSQAAISGHGAPAVGKLCLDCHERNARHIGGGTRLKAQLKGALNSECKYCHDNSAVVATRSFQNMSTHFLTKGGSQAMACATCHDPHGSSNLHMIRTTIKGQTIVFKDKVKDFVNTETNMGLCQVCHTETAHYRAGIPELGHPTEGCLDCHQHRGAGGAFKPKGNCNACHGYPPAPRKTSTPVSFGVMGSWSSARFEDYSGGGGAHLVAAHVPKNANPSEGWKNCAVCHNSGASGASPYHRMILPVKSHIDNVTVAVDPKLRFSNGFISYTGSQRVNTPGQNATGSCFNVSCHISKSPRWSIER